MAADRSFFDQVQDAFEGFVVDVDGELHATAHKRGLKVWFDDANREHYEAQLIRLDGEVALEVGFHVEHPKVEQNDRLLERLVQQEADWRPDLGDDPVAGEFLGADRWRRISETWEPPDPDDVDATIEVAARLAEYVTAIEPVRRSR